ncbi:hypothetical protein HHI36_015478 [Cryptolaemus montrouzieri]|uniref:Adenosine 5'-monophosphoramidase HINT3 n=1 Tax=Cryptolaemus montrouzieri TaxID=559131 RepID=A0ABD2N643_9CUCU
MTNCIFCKIISGNEPAHIIYSDDEMIVFTNIKPAATYHFLVATRNHIENINSLNSSHIPLVERMARNGKRAIEQSGGI